MEFTLWNLNAPAFWASSANSCSAGETVAHVLCSGNAGELQADDDEPFPTAASPPPCTDSVYHNSPHLIAVKADPDIEKDHNCLVTLELAEDLGSTALDTELELKGVSTFSLPSPAKKEAVFKSGKIEVIVLEERYMYNCGNCDAAQRKLNESADEETSDSGQAVDDECETLPTVDNLWNNGIVGANVNVKTETVIPLAYQLEDYGPIFGRLPAKRLDPLSDESDEEKDDLSANEDDQQEDEDAEEYEEVEEEEEDVEGEEEEEEEENEEEDGGGEEEEGEEEDEEDDGDDEGDEVDEEAHLRFEHRSGQRLPTGNIGYECGECSYMAETRPALKKHIAMMHPAPTSDLAQVLMRKLSQSTCCPLAGCRFRSTDRVEMENHVARHVAGGGQIAAPSPTKKKAASVNLQRVRYEREEYRCQMCTYSCTIEKAFYKHLKLHSLGGSVSTSSKISCVVCGKDRPTEVDMNKHMRKHRDNRYFCCDICVFRTVQLKKLIQHRRMHTGEKPHLCPHCPYRSARRDNLRSHVRRVHKKENLYCDTFSPRGLLLNTGSNNSSSYD